MTGYMAPGAYTPPPADHAPPTPPLPDGTIPMPRYTGAVIYSCPECDGDLEHAGGTEYWCRACQRTRFFAEIVPWEDGDIDD